MLDDLEQAHHTPTETLVACLERFGEDEPISVLVIHTAKSGDISWSSNTSSLVIQLGMIETAKCLIQRQLGEMADKTDRKK